MVQRMKSGVVQVTIISISYVQVGVPRSVKATAVRRPEVSAAAATAATMTAAAATAAEAAHVPMEANLPQGGNNADAEVAETGPDAPAESSEAVGGPGTIGPSGPSALSLLSGAAASSSLAAGPDEGQHHGPGSGRSSGGTAAVLTRSDRKRQWKQLRRDKKARRGDLTMEEASPAPAWIPGECMEASVPGGAVVPGRVFR